MEGSRAKKTTKKISFGSKIPRSQVKQIEMICEAQMMVEVLTQTGKIRMQTQIHNSMFDLTIRGQVAEIDSFIFGTSIGEGTGRVHLRQMTGSYN